MVGILRDNYETFSYLIVENAAKMPDCSCSEQAPSCTVTELGPVWAGELYDVDFIRGMLQHRFPCDEYLQSLLLLLLEESEYVNLLITLSQQFPNYCKNTITYYK